MTIKHKEVRGYIFVVLPVVKSNTTTSGSCSKFFLLSLSCGSTPKFFLLSTRYPSKPRGSSTEFFVLLLGNNLSFPWLLQVSGSNSTSNYSEVTLASDSAKPPERLLDRLPSVQAGDCSSGSIQKSSSRTVLNFCTETVHNVEEARKVSQSFLTKPVPSVYCLVEQQVSQTTVWPSLSKSTRRANTSQRLSSTTSTN